jgi:hypothetical protein
VPLGRQAAAGDVVIADAEALGVAIVSCGSDQPGLSFAGSPTGPELKTQNGCSR